MDIEFHFYMTHLIALRAGFKPDDAFTIAYASQYTDDNENVYEIKGRGNPYVNMISQTMDITKPQGEHLSIYPAFHFCPAPVKEIFAQAPLRTDGVYHSLDTLPDNGNARTIFEKAMASGNLHRIGMGAHMYADTFCHRDFVGYKHTFNWLKIDGLIKGLLDDILPCIGHALAMHQPDLPALVWEDTRLTSKYRLKKNKDQILGAAENIFDFFCLNTKPTNAKKKRNELIEELTAAIGEEATTDSAKKVKTRINNYKTLLGENYKDYNKAEWFNDAIETQVDGKTAGTSGVKLDYFWKDDYSKSNWFQFQEAVKAHHTVALKVFGPTFGAMEIDIASV